VVKFCEFELRDIDSEAIDNVDWTIAVSRDEVEELGYAADNLRLVQLQDGNWEVIATEEGENTTDDFVFEASTEDFGDGAAAVASVDSGIFNSTNLLYCGAGLLALAGILVLAYIIMNRSNRSTSSSSANSARSSSKSDKKR
jgi:hypothetical protein